MKYFIGGGGELRYTEVLATIILCAFSAVIAVVSCGCRRDSAPAGKQVVLYCSADQQYAEPIIAEFTKRTGIDVRVRFDIEASKTVGLVQRLRAEAQAPVADVFWSSEVFHTVRLARDGLLAEYAGPATAARKGRFADGKGRWHGFALRARVIGYSTQRVPAAEAPQTLEDLLDSRWRGRIVMADPRFGTTGGDVASWFAHYGRDRARAILAALKANEVRLVDGNSTAVRMVATGQADICLTDTDDVYAAQRNGWPIAMNFLDQGGDGVLTIPNTVAVIAGAPHPQQAGALMEFLLSADVEEMLAASDSHNCPTHPDAVGKFPQYAIPKPLQVDYGKVADALNEAIASAGEVLR